METAHHKAELNRLLLELTDELKKIGIHDPANTKNWQSVPDTKINQDADPNDAADHVEDWNERRATTAILETRYNNIIRALNKIDNGTFGVCEISGKVIEADRLAVNPAARTCKAHLEDEVNLPK